MKEVIDGTEFRCPEKQNVGLQLISEDSWHCMAAVFFTFY
jgi:hypothetical protein